MVSKARQRLSEDHQIATKVLKQLLTALDNQEVHTSYAKLDLLWARLAVHIRAEHLYLFPAVTNRLRKSRDDALPNLSEALVLVEDLRADHDFFMRELARGMGMLRELPEKIVTAGNEARLTAVSDIIRAVEKRLATHNETEENQIYRWSSTILSKPEQLMLLELINTELEKRPPRFSREAWANLH